MSEETPKIHIDSDWKAQAQAEKAKLAEQDKKAAESAAEGGGAMPGQLPPASFETLVSTLATQAVYALGGVQDPQTGQRMVDLGLARHSIDLLGVLEEKTKGNLTEEQADMIAQTVYELRNHYVQIGNAARAQAAADPSAAAPGPIQ
ncbi:MAG: DUF1844 domain-containing protein [Planctomycetota bacterium]